MTWRSRESDEASEFSAIGVPFDLRHYLDMHARVVEAETLKLSGHSARECCGVDGVGCDYVNAGAIDGLSHLVFSDRGVCCELAAEHMG